MGKDSKIEWTHHTFNPWRGCTKVSDGCKFCYADVMSKRNPAVLGIWGPRGARAIAAESYWRQPLKWNRDAEQAGERRRVFCASLADVFEGEDTMPAADWPNVQQARGRLYGLIEDTPHLDWLLLTKRPEWIDRLLPDRWHRADQGFPRNVWLGFSAEDQQRFDERWQIMEWIKRMWHPRVVFCSAEPLLGALDISDALTEIDLGDDEHSVWSATLDWIIAGGESGPNARPAHPDWFRSLRDQCSAAGVPYLFKQWGEYLPMSQMIPGVHCSEGEQIDAPNDRFLKPGKHTAGRLLDGQEWNHLPDVG